MKTSHYQIHLYYKLYQSYHTIGQKPKRLRTLKRATRFCKDKPTAVAMAAPTIKSVNYSGMKELIVRYRRFIDNNLNDHSFYVLNKTNVTVELIIR